jgi:hypothetical protein
MQDMHPPAGRIDQYMGSQARIEHTDLMWSLLYATNAFLSDMR